MADDYSRNEETTFGVTREACNIATVRKKTEIRTPRVVAEVDSAAIRPPELIDAIAAVTMDQNVDVPINAYCLGALWGKLEAPNPVRAPRKADTRL